MKDSSDIKTQITKILKRNGIKKSEVIGKWYSSTGELAGFEYYDFSDSKRIGIFYYVPKRIFSKEEGIKFLKEKCIDIFNALSKEGFKNIVLHEVYVEVIIEDEVKKYE